jgi:hypothetical protein
MDFYTLFPGWEPWVQNLQSVWPASVFKDTVWGFAFFEAIHLLGLGMLGGATLLLNLRLLGAGLTSDAPSVLEQQLRPWLWLGISIVLASGVLIGMLNPEKLYTSPAFFAKMIAMVSALVFSLGVASGTAKAEGLVNGGVRLAAAVAFALWLWAIGVFSLATGANPGTINIMIAGYAILFAFGTKTRVIAAVLLAVGILVASVWTYGFVGLFENYDLFMTINKGFVSAGAIMLVVFLCYEIFTARETDTQPLAKLIGLFSILSWVTVAAAGRWIGLS